MHKHKLNKLIKKAKKLIKKILYYGKLLNLTSLYGNHLGDKEDQAGIYNVPLWQHLYWAKI